MNYRVVRRPFGRLKEEAPSIWEEVLPKSGEQMLCESSGGRWDAIGACICPPDRLYDFMYGGCKREEELSYAAKREYQESGAIARGDIPEILVTDEELKGAATGIGLWGALVGAAGLIGFGAGVAYFLYGGEKPYYKPEFEWEED